MRPPAQITVTSVKAMQNNDIHFPLRGKLSVCLIINLRQCQVTADRLAQLVECRAGGRGFKPRPDQHSGSLNN